MMSTGYQIRVKGELAPDYAAWFGSIELAHTPDGDTLLIAEEPDQAALYGMLLRCRDLGLSLISVNPLPVQSSAISITRREKEEQTMNTIHAEASRVIHARPEEIYAVIADYHVGHPAILPKPYFTGLVVEQGGQGAGTVVMTTMNIFGSQYRFHQVVSEPEPGRVLVETDMDTGQFSQFILEPLNGGTQTRVTISSEFPPGPGIRGLVERLTQPAIARHIYRKELNNLAEYLRRKQTAFGLS